MLPVKIDLSELISGYSLSNEEASELSSSLVERMTGRFVTDLKEAAKNKLGRTRAEYLRSIVVSKEKYNVAVVELVGVVPNMVEQGASSFDMKEGFKKSKYVEQKLDGGWYLTIPFQHAIAGSVGEQFASVMSETMTNVATSMPKGGQLSRKDLPVEEQVRGTRPRIVMESRVFEEYKHKHARYEGLNRMTGKGQGGYVTFRRVSNSSDPDSWIHSGIEARNLFREAFNEERILHEIDLTRDEFFAKLGI